MACRQGQAAGDLESDQGLVKMRTGGASNRSLGALMEKSREDLFALRKNRSGGLLTLLCKNVRKLPQFFTTPQPPAPPPVNVTEG